MDNGKSIQLAQRRVLSDWFIAPASRTTRHKSCEDHLLVPVSYGHHDIKGSKKHHEMEEGIAVGHCTFFVIVDTLPWN